MSVYQRVTGVSNCSSQCMNRTKTDSPPTLVIALTPLLLILHWVQIFHTNSPPGVSKYAPCTSRSTDTGNYKWIIVPIFMQ